MKKIVFFATVGLCFLWGCSSDEGPSDSFLGIDPAEVSFNTLNTCDIGGCCLATEFDFTIAYESSGGPITDKIMVSIEWSDGDTDTFETDDFNDSGSVVSYDWCYRFADSEWVKVSHVLVTVNGVKSAPSDVQVNKPAGAN